MPKRESYRGKRQIPLVASLPCPITLNFCVHPFCVTPVVFFFLSGFTQILVLCKSWQKQ